MCPRWALHHPILSDTLKGKYEESRFLKREINTGMYVLYTNSWFMFALKVNFSVIVCFICVYIFIHRNFFVFFIVLYFRDSSTVFVSVAL